MKNILLTGGTGYIGSHTCIELLKRNYKITILDSLINSKSKTLDRIFKILEKEIPQIQSKVELCIGDIRDIKYLEQLFNNNKIKNNSFDGVIHFCGLKAVNESISNPIEYWDVNVGGTINLMKVMKSHNCNVLVFSSSATVYGNTLLMPIKENTPMNPLNPYGQTKAAIERLLFDVFNAYSETFKIAILRYFNPVGAHDSGLLGELPLGSPNNIFPLLNQTALGLRSKFEIFGNNWPTKDGTCIRDYIHVMDLAYGHVCALDYLFDNQPHINYFNLGTGKGTSVLELVKIFQDVNEVNFPVIYSNRRDGDIAEAVADNNTALEKLNWLPKKTINQMCQDGWKWYLNNSK